MSHIFDALQRSEAERTGRASSSLGSITELLEQAERGTATRLDPAIAVPSTNGHTEKFLDTEISPAAEISVLDTPSSPLPVEFEHCETLELCVTPENRLATVSDSESPAAEAFRLLSVRLRHIRRERTLKRLLITSSIPQEGKSMVSANLACALAATTRRRVLLLEGDVRRPSLSRVFGIKPPPGLCEWLNRSRNSLAASIYRLNPGGIWFLPAGNPPANPLELLESGRLPGLLEQLDNWFDWIIIDSPPALPLADTSVWSRLADGILLVTRQGTTPKRQLQRTVEGVDRSKLLGAVLNSSKSTSDNHYYSYRRSTEGAAD
jgi:capsular exopolysaccharide synthesis family protein